VAAGNRDRGRDKGRKWSRPSLLNAWKGARATGISVDWLLGFDVPRARSDREKIGAVLPELRQQLAARLAAKLGTTAEFASAVLPSGEQLFTDLIERYRDLVRSRVLDKRFLEEGVAQQMEHLGLPRSSAAF